MSKELVVKTNRLNQAFQTLSLSEFHIVQLAIVDARHTGTGTKYRYSFTNRCFEIC